MFGKWADEAAAAAATTAEKQGGRGGGTENLPCEPDSDLPQGTGEATAQEGETTGQRGETTGQGGAAGCETATANEGAAPPLVGQGGRDSVRHHPQDGETALPATDGGTSVLPFSPATAGGGSSSPSPAETAWSMLSRGGVGDGNVGSSGGDGSGDGVGGGGDISVSGGGVAGDGDGGGVGGGGSGGGSGVDGGDVVGDADGDGGDGAVVVFQLLMQRWELRPWVVGPRTLVATKEQVQFFFFFSNPYFSPPEGLSCPSSAPLTPFAGLLRTMSFALDPVDCSLWHRIRSSSCLPV